MENVKQTHKKGKTVLLPVGIWHKLKVLSDKEKRSLSAQIEFILEGQLSDG